MNTDWTSIIFNSQSTDTIWAELFSALLNIARQSSSPVTLHDITVVPDRLLTEAAWELWEAFPAHAVKTSATLKTWTNEGSGKAVLILLQARLPEPSAISSSYTNPCIPPNLP